MTNYTKKAVKGAGIVFVMMSLSYFLGYVFRLLIARMGGADSLGLVYSIISIYGFFSLFMNFGMRSSLVKYIAEFKATGHPEKIKGAILIVLSATFILSFVVCGLLMIFSDQVATYYFHDSNLDVAYTSLLMRVYGVGVIFSAIILLLRNCFIGFQTVKYFGSVDFVKSVISTALTIALLAMGMKEMAPLLGFTLTYVFFMPTIYGYLFLKNVFPEFWKVKADLSSALAKKLAGFGLSTTFLDAAGMITGYADTMIITFFRGTTESGLYNAAFPTTKLISVVSPALTAVVFPMSSELWVTGKKEQLSRGLSLLYKYVLITTAPIAVVLFLFPDTILATLFGKEFGQAGVVLGILTIGFVFQSFTGANNSALSGIGKPKDAGKIALMGAAVLIVIDLTLVPVYGMMGAALANLVMLITTFILSTLKIKSYVPLTVPWKDFFWVSSACAAIICISYGLASVLSIWPRIAVTILLGAAIYVGVLFASRTLEYKEIKRITKRVR